MRIISLIVLLCFSLNSFASTGTVQELERQLDEYEFALTVEWDQKDQKFYKEQTDLLFEKMSGLVTQGMTKDEVEAVLEKKITNKKALEALKLKLALARPGSTEELVNVLKESRKDLYAQGASWSPNKEEIAGIILVVAIVGYLIWFGANYECVAWTEKWVCDTTSSSSGSSSNSTTTCGWEDRCTAYAKKK